MSFSNIPRPSKGAQNEGGAQTKILSEIDKNMLTELLDIFNHGFIHFYTHQDFRSSFRSDYWFPLSRFVNTWTGATHEFVDAELESYRKRLYEKSRIMAEHISMYTVHIKDDIYSAIHPKSLTEEQLQRDKKDAMKINEVCPEFVAECETFVRYAKSRLAEG